MDTVLHDFEKALQAAWSHETSYYPDAWTQAQPSWGQCAVSTLVAQDVLGGEILWSRVVLPSGETVSHYYNKINSEVIDLTRAQFPEGTVIPAGVPKSDGFATTREYMLSNTDTRRRYELLKERVMRALK